jgi:hypothetical protein
MFYEKAYNLEWQITAKVIALLYIWKFKHIISYIIIGANAADQGNPLSRLIFIFSPGWNRVI